VRPNGGPTKLPAAVISFPSTLLLMTVDSSFLILHSLFKIFIQHSRCLHLRQLDQEEVVPRKTMKVPYSKCRRQLSLSFFVAEGDRQFAACNICRADQRRRYQQRRVLGASAVSERSAEDANLLSVPNPPPRRNLAHGVMGERYHLGGRVETDMVAMATGAGWDPETPSPRTSPR
jgi:hypothetical protein